MATVRDDLCPEIIIIDYPGGCAMVIDPQRPHLGGNMRGGDQATNFTDDLWPWLIKRYAIKAVLDVGCAEGHAMRAFKALGVPTVMGFDGLWQNGRRCGMPMVAHDLTTGPFITEGIDFAWCSDIAEHIEEKYVKNLLDTLACCKYVCLIHGLQGMRLDGWHHVNNKPVEYWDTKMREAGFAIDVDGTAEGKKVSQRGLWPTGGRIFVNQQWPRNWA